MAVCNQIAGGMWFHTPTGKVFASQGDCLFEGVPVEQLQNAVDVETTSTKEDTDWLKWLKTQQASGNTNFMSKYGFLLVGIGVFVLVLIILNYTGKK